MNLASNTASAPSTMPSNVDAIQGMAECFTRRCTSLTRRPVLRSYQHRLRSSVAVPSCTDGPTLIAQQQFNWSDLQFSANANVTSVTFTLPEEMFVSVTGESSAALVSGSAPAVFQTGLYTDPTPNVMWTVSYRRGTLPATDQPVPVHTSMVMKLGAGTHTFYWKLWIAGYTVQFDSGTLTALAVPCSMGGQVQVALQAGAAKQVQEQGGLLVTTSPAGSDLSVTVDNRAGS